MAKMFYTLEETAERLDKSPEDVRDMASSGALQEFRDGDKLMFKVDQVDLLAGDEETGDVSLELEDTSMGMGGPDDASASGTGSAIGLAESGTSIPLSDSREGTGISVFDTSHGEVESGDQTQVGDLEEELNLDSVGSGSGLLDLTRESDDTTLGAELLEEAYSAEDDDIEIPANASGLFEAAGDPVAEPIGGPSEGMGVGAAVPMMVESYDGTGSGLGVGLMIGALVALICIAIVAFVGVTGATASLATSMAGNIWIWAGGLLGLTLILGGVGLFIGKASE